jgi:hypothetical protein
MEILNFAVLGCTFIWNIYDSWVGETHVRIAIRCCDTQTMVPDLIEEKETGTKCKDRTILIYLQNVQLKVNEIQSTRHVEV